MKRPHWVSALAVTFALAGILLAGCALSLFQRVEVDKGGWFPGFAQGLDREIAKFLVVLAILLIVTGLGIWRVPRITMRLTGSTAIVTSLLPFALRLMPIGVLDLMGSFFVTGLALLTLGIVGMIVRLVLFSFGTALIFYSRDAESTTLP